MCLDICAESSCYDVSVLGDIVMGDIIFLNQAVNPSTHLVFYSVVSVFNEIFFLDDVVNFCIN